MTELQHPRPQFTRPGWRRLDGPWRFAPDGGGRWTHPRHVTFTHTILVPFPPESEASGIGDTAFHPVVWYAHTVQLSKDEVPEGGERLLLHFGAVDYRARVWANGQLVAEHEGGHTPFTADLTDALVDGEAVELVVRAEDDPADFAQPRGKQDWQPEPHVIWYPRTTGIWQPVWLEKVPETRLDELVWTPHLDTWEVQLDVSLAGPLRPELSVRVRLTTPHEDLADDRYGVKAARTTRRLALPDAGIAEQRNHLLWSPEHPHLIGAVVELLEGERVLDRVHSYTALRSVGIQGHRFTLNGHPYYLRMVLDQGYWPETLMAATDEQLRRDVELAKQLGFNGVRKHQKVEDPRWLHWCDRLGLLVWEEMPSHYRFSAQAATRLTREWTEVIARDRSHPCVIAWVPFNESWGVPELTTNATHTHYVQALYHLTKTLDPTRLAIGNDGWEFVVGDWLGIHDYAHEPEKLRARYGTPAAVTDTVERPWGPALRVSGFAGRDEPVMLSEFGGVAYSGTDRTGWGYSRVQDGAIFLERYEALLTAVHGLEGISGFCYTQLADTFQEENGLTTEHRVFKADPARLARATRGEANPQDVELEGDADPYGYSRRWWLERQPTLAGSGPPPGPRFTPTLDRMVPHEEEV
ncbi:beta-galactosidase (plasmid) [Deinococcus aetherius]|uniref:Beta-galactosidase n=1 Tax=Deinococcus aetherius TaxID=200252 RepID=A0ABM8AIS8_9DEIO|nr:glycoside hydrolase family 2 TIM barrel-domain containing protein [Deinococcus aetherius]BDP43724.1 beta-galactosidase [Deinococcus aetherius]